MISNNLTIAVPYYGCNKNCKYCVSGMTGNFINDTELFDKNMGKVKSITERSGINNVLITGKGEPLIDGSFEYTTLILKYFANHITEVQTNGINLNAYTTSSLVYSDVNVIAISIDSIDDLNELFTPIKQIKRSGSLVRLTVNLSDLTKYYLGFERSIYDRIKNIFDFCYYNSVDQLTFRKLSIPYGCEDTKQAEWIRNFANPKKYKMVLNRINNKIRKEGTYIRTLNHGVSIYDYNGIGVSISEYCIQENHNESNLRSLIFIQDGHLYTHWGKKGSIIL